MSATTSAKSFLPTGQEAIAGVKDLGMVASGMIAAHAIVTMTKKDTAIVNGGIAVLGLGVAMKAKNPLVKMLALGASAYGSIKLLNSVTKEVAAPNTTEGLNGLLPESAKAMIRKFIPTLSGVEGAEENVSGNDDDDIKGLSLEDFSTRGTEENISSPANELEGLGEILNLVA